MLALLGPLGTLLGMEAAAVKDRLVRQTIVFGLLGVLGVVALAFLLVAANTALAFAVGPVVAPLIIAGAALLLGLVVYLVFHLRAAMEERREAEQQRTAEMTALITSAALTAVPLLLPAVKRFGLPAGGAAAALYALLHSRAANHRE